MSIKTSMVSCVRIPGSDDLDPITVYLENYEPGKGKITIECWGKAWSSAWPAMTGRSVEQFFVDAGVSYLAGYLDNDAKPEILNPDMDELREALCREVAEYQRNGLLDDGQAKILHDQAQEVEMGEGYCTDYGLLSALYGDDWYESSLQALSVPNQKYVTLCKIIEAVKVGLKEYIHLQAESAAPDEAESLNREGLTVWRGHSPRLGFDHVIATVAARTKGQAMEILGLQPHEFNRGWVATDHPQCLEVALAAPGVVFHAKRLREDGWWAFRAVRHK